MARGRVLSTAQGTRPEAFGPAEWGLLSAVALMWGSSFLWIDIGLEAFRPPVIAVSRIVRGALALGFSRRSRTPVAREDWPRVVLLAFVWTAIPLLLFPIAQDVGLASSSAGMINGAMPLFAALFATLFLRRLPGSLQALGLLVGFAGVVLVSLAQRVGHGDAGRVRDRARVRGQLDAARSGRADPRFRADLLHPGGGPGARRGVPRRGGHGDGPGRCGPHHRGGLPDQPAGAAGRCRGAGSGRRARTVKALFLVAILAVHGPAPAAADQPATCLGHPVTIQGTPSPDVLTGTEGDDVIIGKKGNDRVNGLGGNDLICGEEGRDTLDGGAGDDALDGGSQGDTFIGNVGIDTVCYAERTRPIIAEIDRDTGDDGDPTIRSGRGEGDTIKVSVENVVGGTGNDSMVGTDAANTFRGRGGTDTFSGGGGPDLAHGGGGQDFLRGEGGNDTLLGAAGRDDTLLGGPGQDTLIGGGGIRDQADGEGGTDTCDAEQETSCERDRPPPAA